MAELASRLGGHSSLATEAIMTTDTKPKELAVEFEWAGKNAAWAASARAAA
jgi:N-acetylglutamate synthase/N-acetylornithine aminotransferase